MQSTHFSLSELQAEGFCPFEGGKVVVLQIMLAVGPGGVAHEDGGKRERQEMLWATPASLGGCGGRISLSSCSVLSLFCPDIR